LDSNAELKHFCETLEAIVIQTVESGHMTKDLAICIEGTFDVPRAKYLNTQEFILKVAENLKVALKK